jgi:putative ABC transport system permease protein
MHIDIIKMSIQAIKKNKTNSILTALGIIVGTAIVVIVLSVGSGVRALILDQLSNITPESLWIEVQIPSKGTQGEKDTKSGQSRVGGIEITTLKRKDTEDLKTLRNVENGFSVVTGQEKFTYKSKEKRALFWGVSHEYQKMEKLKIGRGRFFTDKEDRSLARVVVLGSDVKKALFPSQDPIGEKIKIRGQSYIVIGTAEPIGIKFFMNMDEMVYIPIQTAQKKILGQDHILAISLKMKNKEYLESTVSQIERRLRKNHNIQDPVKDDFVVRTMDESMEIVDTVTSAISILLFSIACISLLVGGIGIMNIMYVSVSDRTQEIGLKKAIGASPSSIQFQFLVESVAICIVGGILGVGLGIGISWLVSFGAQYMDFQWPFILPYSSLFLAFFISFGIGILFGYAPAKKAARLHPIDALRRK